MAWNRHDQFDKPPDRDLMGVHGDVLFADPLGVRAGSQKSQSSSAPQQQRNNAVFGGMQSSAPRGAPQDRGAPVDEPEVQQPEEEQWGPIGSFFWHILAGGKQCCSMRDRTKPQDMEAAKKAAETGRPPQSRFPEPPKQGALDHTFGAQDQDRPLFGGGQDRSWQSARQPPAQQSSFGASRPQYSQQGGLHDSDSESESEPYSSRPGQGQGRQPDVSSFSGWNRPSAIESQRPSERAAPPSGERPPPLLGSSTVGGGGPPSQSAAGHSGARGGGSSAAGAGGPSASPAAAELKRWEWPPWCLNFKAPCIEVYVVDDETGVGKWVEAEPQSRVVDKAGRDAYLCVEYEWDGEYYVQDFGPQHVRRRGQKQTVFQVFEQESGRHDTGGGISAFLSD